MWRRCFFSGNRFQGDLEDHVSDNLKHTLQCIDNYDDDDDVDDNDNDNLLQGHRSYFCSFQLLSCGR